MEADLDDYIGVRHDNDAIAYKIDDMDNRIGELRDLILEVQRQQMWSNTRIRQDVVSCAASTGLIFLAVIAIWSRQEWQFWYLYVLLVGMPFVGAYLYSQVSKQDSPIR